MNGRNSELFAGVTMFEESVEWKQYHHVSIFMTRVEHTSFTELNVERNAHAWKLSLSSYFQGHL